MTLAGSRRGTGALVAGGALVAAAVVALVMGVGVAGLGVRRTVAPAVSATSTTSPPTTLAARRLVAPEPVATAEIRATAEALEPPPVLAGMDAGDLVRVRVRGFPARASGALGLCDRDVCRDTVPILTDGRGDTDVAYRLGADCGAPSCALVVDVGGVVGSAVTVFGATPPAPLAVVRVERTGSRVDVVVRGARPGATLTILACPENAIRRSGCRPLGDAPVVAGAGGQASLRAVAAATAARVVVADVGTGETIAWPVDIPHATVVVVRPEYGRARVTTTLLVALLLVMVAAWLVRSTDWGPPAEAAP